MSDQLSFAFLLLIGYALASLTVFAYNFYSRRDSVSRLRSDRLLEATSRSVHPLPERYLVMEAKKTPRGFAYFEFQDLYDAKCSLQKSSLATEDAIWLGVDDCPGGLVQIMASQAREAGVETEETTGWVEYPLPDGANITTRMHISRAQVEAILPVLELFVKTGELPDNNQG